MVTAPTARARRLGRMWVSPPTRRSAVLRCWRTPGPVSCFTWWRAWTMSVAGNRCGGQGEGRKGRGGDVQRERETVFVSVCFAFQNGEVEGMARPGPSVLPPKAFPPFTSDPLFPSLPPSLPSSLPPPTVQPGPNGGRIPFLGRYLLGDREQGRGGSHRPGDSLRSGSRELERGRRQRQSRFLRGRHHRGGHGQNGPTGM